MSKKILKNFLLTSFVFCFSFLIFTSVEAADIKTYSKELPAPKVVTNTVAELNTIGCVERELNIPSPFHRTYYMIPDGYQYIEPKDGNFGYGYFCPSTEEVDAQLKVVNKVAPSWQRNFIWIINQMILVIGSQLLALMRLSANVLAATLGFSQYITNPFVTAGWPFLQGIANLGFILALLFIATSTTLRLDIGGGIKRLLPRLLIAALLINFSLVIGAVLIDASRLLMAIEIGILSGGEVNMNNIGSSILQNSTLTNSIALGAEHGNYSWSVPADLARRVFVIGILTMGMVAVAVMLVIRHIALILLLLFSPLAYLAWAIPKADFLASRWWQEFLKWTMYGPILLFFLILIAVIQPAITSPDNNEPIAFSVAAINVGITTALLFISAKFGMSMAGSGGTAAFNMVSKQGKRAAGWAWRNPGKAGAIAAGVATGGLAAPLVGGLGGLAAKGAYNQARDFRKTAGKGLTNQWNKTVGSRAPILKADTRDAKGSLKPGETSRGERLGERLDPKKRDEKKLANTHYNDELLTKGGSATATSATAATIKVDALRNTSAASKLSTPEASNLVVNVMESGDTNRQLAAMNNIELVRKIKEDGTAVDAIYDRGNTEIIKKFDSIIKRIEDEDKK